MGCVAEVDDHLKFESQKFWLAGDYKSSSSRIMSKDALAALRRHFEEEYGKLDLGHARGKKRKRKQVIEEAEEEKAQSDSEEWQGIENGEDNEQEQTIQPEVIVFKDDTQDDNVSVMKSSAFMVRMPCLLL